MTYTELVDQYNKITRRLQIYYILYNEKVSESINLKIEKRVHNLMYARNDVVKQIKEMEDNNNGR